MTIWKRLQTTHPTSGGAVTSLINCCANCAKPSRPQQWGPDLMWFFFASRSCIPAGWLALLLTNTGDDETNPGPTTLNKLVWICDIYYKQIHVRKQMSIRCNMIEQDNLTDTPNDHRSNSKSERNLIIQQVNINGTKNKLEELKLLIHDTHAYIITIQETKFTPKAKTPKLHNFTTVRADRLHKAGGGLIALIRDNITLTTTDIP